MLYKKIQNKGFTLVETLVGAAVFLIVSMAAYQAYVSLFLLINQSQYKILALNLANEQFEIIRNLNYKDVGTQGSIPNGLIPHIQNFIRGGITFTVISTIRNVDLPFDGTLGGSPNDLSPADNKTVEVEVDCPTCKSYVPVILTTNVAPKNLETASTNGALFVKVFDANGVPISNASVHIARTSPNIVIDDVTDVNGMLQIVDVPPGVEAYEITVTKAGYSTDKTYPTGAVGNPSPTKPHATVALQQVTQISFSIDNLSTMSFTTVTSTCVAVPGTHFSLTGSKQIGLNVPKYSQNHVTNIAGSYSDSAMEWDTYTAVGTDNNYDIVGINPLNPINLNPGSTQNVDLIVAPKDPDSLLITVKDNSTLLPVTDAQVTVTDGASYNQQKITHRGFLGQSDWSAGDYFSNDGNIETLDPVGELRLKDPFSDGNHNPIGVLESSTFDTGSASNFYNLIWLPSDQPVQSGPNSVKLQIATATTSSPTAWSYFGPDGTASTFYDSPNMPIASIHNNDRYFRYKVFLATDSSTSTPNISDVDFTFTSSCTPPGQVVFTGLSSGTYHVTVIKAGYSPVSIDVIVDSLWKEQEIILQP